MSKEYIREARWNKYIYIMFIPTVQNWNIEMVVKENVMGGFLYIGDFYLYREGMEGRDVASPILKQLSYYWHATA